MGRKTNQKFQHAAARLELEAKGTSEITIQELERDWDAHTARQGRVTPKRSNAQIRRDAFFGALDR